ncbi:DUF86 domain-containing protein [Rhodoplanes azumiensis]|uniref:DUF86 domain-containing protein n=1 Tax=Rhodoplanes azumiensis TaxID=1897628 RepID=A0ABW5AQU2_9BRAD
MSHSTVEYLRDAREMADRAADFGTLDASVFTERHDACGSAAYCLVVLGEALNNIPSAVASLAPEIPWRAAINMRHLLVRYYWRVDFEIVHEVVSRDCPRLVAAIDRLLPLVETVEP